MLVSSLIGHTHEVLGNIGKSDKPADSLLDSFFRSRRYLGSHDRKFIAETTYGILRHRLRCEALLEEAAETSLVVITPENRLLWMVLAYLISVEKNDALSSDFVKVVEATVEGKQQAATMVEKFRGGLQRIPSNEFERISREYSFQEWMVRRMIDEYGPQGTEAICRALNQPAPLSLRVNTLRTTPEECQSTLRAQGVETTRTRLSPVGLQVPKRINLFKLPAFRDGLFEVQDEGSQLIPMLIDPKPTDKVLDACAGAGGKTLQLAALMRNRGEIIAADINEFRLRELKKRCKRAGAFNIRIKPTDELLAQSDSLKEHFDVVFIDAPCSGLGTIRRNPGMKWSVTERAVGELSAKQEQLLKSYAGFVKPGGLLVYTTCTMLREENEDVLSRFLDGGRGFKPVDPGRHVRKTGVSDCVRDGNFVVSPDVHGTDGFFCSVLERVPD